MPAVQYPFIDIAVHERVKDRFARGDAIVLFSLDLADVYWANGRGAALFGQPLIYDLIEDGPNPNDVTFRQVEATGRQLVLLGESRRFLIRIALGFQRVPVQAVVERIRLTEDVDALLFAAPVDVRPLAPGDIARDMLEGFDDADTHMAVLGAEGEIIANSPGFESLGLKPATARTLVSMAGSDPHRLVKRPVPTAKGYLPAAIGKVSDAPALHLLFAVETILGNMAPATPFPEDADVQPRPAAATEPVAVTEVEGAAPAIPEALAFPEDPPDVISEEADTAVTGTERHASSLDAVDVDSSPDVVDEDLFTDFFDTGYEDTGSAVAETPATAVEEAKADRDQDRDPAEEEGFVFDRSARPTRFVWKIDAEGLFSEVSPELAAAVGPHADDLAGTSFTDIANLLALDPEGKIGELLGRRDTWSGKTIYWPIEGTSLKAPVDLAALPTYRRNREFDGFRGFGIVRLSDAVDDPRAIGLTLAGGRAADAAADDDATDSVSIDRPDRSDLAEAEAEAETPVEEAVSETGAAPDDITDVIDGIENVQVGTPIAVAEPGEARDRVEPPVLRMVEPARVHEEDKVIRLEERRLRGREGLTPGEQEAFREIARRLEPLTRAREDETVDTSFFSEFDTAPDGMEQSVSPVDDAPASVEASDSAARPESPVEDGRATDAMVPAEAFHPEAAAPEPDRADGEPGASDPLAAASESAQLEILAASIPPRTAMDGGLTTEALDEIPVALLIHAGDRLIHANPEFLSLSGYRALSELEAVGGLDSLLHHKDLEGMPDQSGGLSLVRADDRLVPVTARLQSVRWDNANALLLALIPSGPGPVAAEPRAPSLTDEDEERLNGRIQDLEVEVDQLKSILETATDGVVIIGPEGDIRSMNRSASALFDYDDAETRGKPFVMLFAHESHRAVADYLAGMTGHGVASVLNDGREVIGREASGGFIPLFMTIGRLSSSTGFCAVIRDITQWKRSEEDLKSAKRAAETANAHKSDFLARVSHEIRTPLNAIIGFSDMMAIEHFGPIGHSRYVEYANDIARSGRLVLDIVNDLLDISKIEAGEMELEFMAVRLNEAVSEAVSLVQPQAHAERVIIRTAFSDAVPDVVADLRSIKQIVLNILANAIRFTPAGGQIVVSTSYEANGSVVLRIRDTGVGMTRAELEQAMKPFRQVTGGGRKRGDGTGLGLPLTKAMVDANRANFAIQSTPNQGTLVEIAFPSPRVLAN